MSLSVGIVGLPNSGKSTFFNALMMRQIANVAEYPYTTIEPNVGVVEVSDERLDKIADVLAKKADPSTSLGPSALRLRLEETNRPRVVPAAIRFIDIAGLIKGAHQGEGLGNQFLGHIREVDVILHVVRAFEHSEVSHVHGKIDPQADIDTVNDELKKASIDKPTIYILNVSEKDLQKEFDLPFDFVKVCAKLEADLSDLSEGEQKEYLKESGVGKSALDEVIKKSYILLSLITFFTIAGGSQVQAWPVKVGTTMIEAGSIVHTDFAKGFIAAEVIEWQKLIDCGSWHDAKENGFVHTAGRDEEVKDGEVIEFKFRV